MALGLFWATGALLLFLAVLCLDIMGFFSRKNRFPVDGRTVVITGGSQGLGRGLAKALARKGANVVIVARNSQKLEEALGYISGAAIKPEQRFHYISADVTRPEENNRILEEVTAWNNNQLPDIVWANAGSSIPTLFVDTPIDVLRAQMDINYFSAAYLAQATMKAWLRPTAGEKSASASSMLPRHFVITSSSAAFVGVAGYTPYSPAKAALRNLSDALRLELSYYNGAARRDASSRRPDISIHCLCPGTIASPGYKEENAIKHPITAILEDGDPVQSEDEAAAVSLKELEKGHYLIATNLLAKAMRAGAISGSPRNNWFVDTMFAWLSSILWLFIGPDMEGKVFRYGKKHGA
ncbi:NAD(P)-binding protein [Saccharata proteae CBS 121410]|uniref:3-dehydrosphinganine reductase n=1 Tax=Saccharata proteae CBS 121410 TaxID=1314787 RepID=A0A6A5YB94_9PEZI|nr:NAD(P)-binding protein [Saccharata proteae CBS 121410]